MKRLKPGELRDMSPEDRRAHIKELQNNGVIVITKNSASRIISGLCIIKNTDPLNAFATSAERNLVRHATIL